MDPRDATRLTALGQRLRTLRLERGLRADDLANSVAISRMTLYRLERGDPGIATGVLYRVLQAHWTSPATSNCSRLVPQPMRRLPSDNGHRAAGPRPCGYPPNESAAPPCVPIRCEASMTTFLPAEVAQTLLKLTAGPDSVVVGGQAVSLWAAKFGLLRPDVALTRDLDLLGMAENVDDAAQAIRAAGMTVRAYLPALEDITPISGKLSVDVLRLKEPVEIDFLHQVDGLNASDIQERALSLVIDGVELQVLHPLIMDLLEVGQR